MNSQLQSWSKIKDVQISAVVFISEQVSETTLREQLSDLLLKDIDAIELCVPVAKKKDMIRQLYKSEVYIITNSPVAVTSKDAAAIIQECKDQNVRLISRNQLYFSQEYIHAKNEFLSGTLGNSGVNRLSVKTPHPGVNQDIFLTIGVFQFEWLVQTFGRVKRVMAKHVLSKHQDKPLVEYSLISLRMENNSFIHMELSWGGNDEIYRFELAGEKGMLTYNSSDSIPIQIQALKSEKEVPSISSRSNQKEMESIALLISEGNLPRVLEEERIHAIAIAEAAKKSVFTGMPIQLKEGDKE